MNAEALMNVELNWFQAALFETSPHPKGNFKQAWTMKLMRSGHRCRLPRGFIKSKKPIFVGRATGKIKNQSRIGNMIMSDVKDTAAQVYGRGANPILVQCHQDCNLLNKLAE